MMRAGKGRGNRRHGSPFVLRPLRSCPPLIVRLSCLHPASPECLVKVGKTVTRFETFQKWETMKIGAFLFAPMIQDSPSDHIVPLGQNVIYNNDNNNSNDKNIRCNIPRTKISARPRTLVTELVALRPFTARYPRSQWWKRRRKRR